MSNPTEAGPNGNAELRKWSSPPVRSGFHGLPFGARPSTDLLMDELKDGRRPLSNQLQIVPPHWSFFLANKNGTCSFSAPGSFHPSPSPSHLSIFRGRLTASDRCLTPTPPTIHAKRSGPSSSLFPRHTVASRINCTSAACRWMMGSWCPVSCMDAKACGVLDERVGYFCAS